MIAMLWMTAAQADQCAAVSKEKAREAVEHVPAGATWASYCEPCGDKAPVLHKSSAGAVARTSSIQGLWEVAIDGKAVDLAYVYVSRPKDDKLVNLAALAGCETTGVSRAILPPR